MGRAVDSWCVCKQSHDASLTTTPFIYLSLTTTVYWYRPVLSSGISWKEQYRTCAALVSGVYFGKIWGPGDRGGKRIPGPTFQGLVVVFPVEERSEKEKDFCANRASGHQCNCHFPFRFFFDVSGMVWITVQSVICPFHGCLRPKASSYPHLFPYLQLSLYNWILCCCLTTVRHRVAGCDTQVCDSLSYVLLYKLQQNIARKQNS